MLLQAATDNFLTTIGEKVTIIGALGFFLYYFMKEVKAWQAQYETMRKAYEDKIDKLMEKYAELQLKTLDALNKNTASNDAVVNIVEDMKEVILNTQKPLK